MLELLLVASLNPGGGGGGGVGGVGGSGGVGGGGCGPGQCPGCGSAVTGQLYS